MGCAASRPEFIMANSRRSRKLGFLDDASKGGNTYDMNDEEDENDENDCIPHVVVSSKRTSSLKLLQQSLPGNISSSASSSSSKLFQEAYPIICNTSSDKYKKLLINSVVPLPETSTFTMIDSPLSDYSPDDSPSGSSENKKTQRFSFKIDENILKPRLVQQELEPLKDLTLDLQGDINSFTVMNVLADPKLRQAFIDYLALDVASENFTFLQVCCYSSTRFDLSL